MSYNAGLLFYRHYYEGFNWSRSDSNYEEDFFRKKNQQLAKTKADANYRYPAATAANGFALTTTYPGLVLGTGYQHGSGLQGEFKIGFFFDHTTGLPVISGSSVKGVLRSFFPLQYAEAAADRRKKAAAIKSESEQQIKKRQALEREAEVLAQHAHLRYGLLRSILQKLKIAWEASDVKIDQLERAIFQGLKGTDSDDGDHHLPVSQRDIFHDATIEAAPQGVLAEDFVTPHRNPKIKEDGIPHALKNPVPIKFIKVLPQVTFRFRFAGTDALEKLGLLTTAQRLALYQELLLLGGVGAKTNVGYGRFQRPSDTIPLPQRRTTKDGKEPKPKKTAFGYYAGRLQTGTELSAEVIGLQGNSLKLKLFIGEAGASKEQEVLTRFPAGAGVGSRLKVKITSFADRKKRKVQNVSIVEWIDKK